MQRQWPRVRNRTQPPARLSAVVVTVVRMSVVTPVGAGRAGWLPAAAASIDRARQLLAPAGIDLEWVACADGAALPALDPRIRPDQVVRWQVPRGISAARNAALASASGNWIVPLDADDELDPTGLHTLARIADQAPDAVGWIGANRVHLDGARTPHWSDTPRHYAAGELAERWTSPFPFHPNSLLVRRDLALTCGGWPGIGVNEDLAAALLFSEAAAGRREPAVLTHYRVWPGQEVATPTYPADKATAFTVIEALVNAQRHRLGRPPVHRPAPGPAHGLIKIPAAQPPDSGSSAS